MLNGTLNRQHKYDSQDTYSYPVWMHYVDGLEQEKHNFITNTLELYLSCTNQSLCKLLLYSIQN